MLGKFRRRWILDLLVLVVLLGLGGYVLLIPYAARWEVLRILQAYGMATPDLEMNVASAYRMNITEFVSGEDRAARVGSLTIDYSPWIIYSRRVSVITINGVEVTVKIKDGKVDLGSLGPVMTNLMAHHNTDPMILPFDRLEIKASSVVFDFDGIKTRVPMEGFAIFKAGAEGDGGGALHFEMLAEPLAVPLRLHSEVDTKTWTSTTEVSVMTGKPPKTGAWIDPPNARVMGEDKTAGDADYMGFVPPVADQSFARVGIRHEIKSGHAELTVYVDACADQITLDRAGHFTMTPSSNDGKLLAFPPAPLDLAPPAGAGPGEWVDLRWLYSNLRITLDQGLHITGVRGGASVVYARFPDVVLDRMTVRPQLSGDHWSLSAGGHAAFLDGVEAAADAGVTLPRDLSVLAADSPAQIKTSLRLDAEAKQGLTKILELVAPAGYKPMEGYVQGPSKASLHVAATLTLRPKADSGVKPQPWRVDSGPAADGAGDGAGSGGDLASFEIGPVASPWSPVGIVRSRMNLRGLSGSITPDAIECSLPADEPGGKTHGLGFDADLDLYPSTKNHFSSRRADVSASVCGGMKMTWPQWTDFSFANLALSCPDLRLGYNRNVASPVGDQDFAPPPVNPEKFPGASDENPIVRNFAGVAMTSVSCKKGRLEFRLQEAGSYLLASMLQNPGSEQSPKTASAGWQMDWTRFALARNSEAPLLEMDLTKQSSIRGGLVVDTAQPLRLTDGPDSTLQIPGAQLTAGYRLDILGDWIIDSSLNVDGLSAHYDGVDASLDSLRLSGRSLIGAADGPFPGDLMRLETEAIGISVKNKSGALKLQHALSPRTTLRLREDGSWTADTGLTLEGFWAQAPAPASATLEASRVGFSGHAEADAGGVPKYALNLSGVDGKVTSGKFLLTDCAFDFPITSTPADPAAPPDGKLTIGKTKYNSFELAPIAGSLSMHAMRLKSALSGNIYDAANLSTTADVDFAGPVPAGTVTAVVPAFKIAKPRDLMIDLSNSGLPMGDADVTGTVALDAKASINGSAIDPMVTVRVIDASFSSRYMNAEAAGINAAVTIDRLSPLSSLGGQELSCKTARVAKLNVRDVHVLLRVEAADQVEIEQARAGWGPLGVIYATAFRVGTKALVFDTNLIFEAVDLGDVLDAFAHGQASGSGRLYGRIPFVISPGAAEPIKIGSGFLFMKNGETGTIKITDPNTLSSIDKEANQYADQAAAKLASLPKGYQDAAHDKVYNSVKGIADLQTSSLFVYFEPQTHWTDMTVHAVGTGRVGSLTGLGIEPTVIVPHVDQLVSQSLNWWYHWSQQQGHPQTQPAHDPLDDLF